MNVNAATEGVSIFSLESAQPDDASNDRIASGRIRFDDFAGEASIPKDRPDRSVIANFFRHLQETERCRHPAPIIAHAEFRSRNRISRELGAIFYEHELLIAHANDDATRTFSEEGGNEEDQTQEKQKEAAHHGVLTWGSTICHAGIVISFRGLPKLILGNHWPSDERET